MAQQLTFIELTERINLMEFMLNNGYTLNRQKSTLKNPVLVSQNGEVIVLKNAGDNPNARYFNATEGTSTMDKGNVVEFVKQRIGTEFKADESLSLYGNVNMILHDYLGLSAEQKQHVMEGNKPTGEPKTKQEFVLSLYNLKPFEANGNNYLEKERGIPAETLNLPEFKDRIYVSNYRGKDFITFPFYNFDGKEISGLNFRAEDTNTNASNTNKLTGVWMSTPPEKIDKIIITESPIDALSHAALNHPIQNTLYISNFGNPTLGQYQSLANTLTFLSNRFDKAPELVMGYDKDVRGNVFALQGYNAVSNGNYFTSVLEDKKNEVVRITVSPFIAGSEAINPTHLLHRDLYLPMLPILAAGQATFMRDKASIMSFKDPEGIVRTFGKLKEKIDAMAAKSTVPGHEIIKAEYKGRFDDALQITVSANSFQMELVHKAFVETMRPNMLMNVRADRPLTKDYNQDLQLSNAAEKNKQEQKQEKSALPVKGVKEKGIKI